MNKEVFYKRLCIVLSAISAACITALAVLVILWPRGVADQAPLAGAPDTSSPIGGNQDEPLTQDNAVAIETPYATLYFPGAWQSYVTYSMQTDGEAVSEVFEATIGAHRVPLYTIHFAKPDVGHAAGTVMKDGRSVSVTVELHEFTPDESWTAEETETLFGLQETVNDVLGALLNP